MSERRQEWALIESLEITGNWYFWEQLTLLNL